MEYEKYYAKRLDGSYLIHFPNRNGLSDDKLTEIFSKFGNVLSLTNNGKPCSLCYVRYRTIEEVKRSIDGIPSLGLKILPHKGKVNEKNVNNKNNNRTSNINKKSGTLCEKKQAQISKVLENPSNSDTVQTLKHINEDSDSDSESDCPPYKTKGTLEHINEGNDSNSQNDCPPYKTKADVQKRTFANTTVLSMRQAPEGSLEMHMVVPNSQSLSHSTASINSNCERDSDSQRRRISSLTSIKNACMLENQSVVSDTCKNVSDYDPPLSFHKRTSITKSTLSILDSEKSKEDMKLDSNIRNEHIEYTGCSHNMPNGITQKFQMVEVIVANIHPNLSVHNILHTLQKYNPLYISTIKKTPVKGIRYCHIYYADAGDATATVNEFDMSDVYGNSLIVFMPQMLDGKTC